MRPVSEVMAFCRAEHENPSMDWEGYCLRFTRMAYGVGALYPDAATAWANTDLKHPTTNPAEVPRGAVAWWLGGSEGHGHVAPATGGGMCWSTDWGGAGQVNLARIADITSQWRLRFVGWSEDINEVPVWEAPVPATPRMDRIVELARLARRATANPQKDADLDRIIALARKWSSAY